MHKLDKLDVIRGFAALYVVFHHSFFSDEFILFGKNLSFLFRFGQEAVILFFLMSGFVIGFSFEKSRDKSFANYFPKRFYRIYIPLIFVFITHYLVICGQAGSFLPIDWIKLSGNLAMLQDAGTMKPNVITQPFLGNTPLWSLSYEWWFYMSFYALYRLFKDHKHLNVFVSALVVVSAASYIYYPFFLNRLFMYFGIWWAGVVMAKSYLANYKVRGRDLGLIFSTLFVATILLALNAYIHKGAIISIGMYPLLELRNFGFTLAAITIAMLWQNFGWFGFKAIDKLKFIAPFSYVLYISHYFLVAYATYLSFISNKYAAFFLYLLIASAYSYIIEVILYPAIRKALTKPKKKPAMVTADV